MLVILGRSCSGKDTIANELIKLGYNRLITFTSRPMRDKEIDGITYNFISLEDFLTKYIDGFFLEARPYKTIHGVWFYGSSFDSYKNSDKNTVCILTPSGLWKLIENNIKFTSFLINLSDEEIKRRQELRGDNISENKKMEAERRFMADKLDFADIDDLVDYTIQNENKNAFDAAKEIDAIYKSLKESE
jgi:guanylate kinase